MPEFEKSNASALRNWNDTKTEIQKTWSNITPEELDLTGGTEEALCDLVQKKCGIPKSMASSGISKILQKFHGPPEKKEKKQQDETVDNEDEKKPEYPNEIYKEDLPPNTQLK